jgi:4-hydroxybenzoate polyprenyltransferase
MPEKIRHYWRLMRLDRPIGIFLLLWPTLWALWLASDGLPDWLILSVFVAGVVLMRSAGCVINDYADRDWDKAVERTAHRPITSGLVSPKEALWLFAGLCLVAFGLVLLLNWQTIAASFVAVFLAILYPFTKRFTHWPQVFLGAAFAWAVPMAFIAQTANWPPLSGWLLFAATLIWALIYDTQYALVDKEDDLKVGIKSTAIYFGERVGLWIGSFQLVFLLLLSGVGWLADLGVAYWFSLIGVALLFTQQQGLIKKGRAGAFKAFLENHWVGLAVFAGMALSQ